MDKETNLMKIMQIIKRRLKTFLIALFTLLIVALSFIFLTNDRYNGAVARLLVGTETEQQTDEYNQITGEPIYEEVIKYGKSSVSEESLVFYTEILKNSGLLEKLITNLDLNYSVSELSDSLSLTAPENSSAMVLTVGSQIIEKPHIIIRELVPLFQEEVAIITDVDKIKVMNISEEPIIIKSEGLSRNIVAAIVISVFVASAVVLIAEYLDDKIHSATDIERIFSIPVIGSLQSKETLEEDLKIIRTNFEYSDYLRQRHVFTLAGLNDSQDNIVIDLFNTISALDREILLIDANLRNPTLHEQLKLSNNLGLSDIISSDANINNSLQLSANPNAKILTAGSQLNNSSEQLSNEKVAKILNEYKQKFDYIIVNGHPVANLSDTFVLATSTDGIVLIVEQNNTKTQDLWKIIQQFNTINVEILGVIFSKI